MTDRDQESPAQKGSAIAGLSVGGALFAGAGGLFGGFIATGNGEFVGGGLYVLAAAVAFGLLANAVFRH